MRVLTLGLLGVVSLFAQDGESLYRRRCASCHDAGAAGRIPGRAALAALSPEVIVRSLRSGTMRAQGRGLSEAELDALAAHIAGKRPGAQVPERGRCADSGPIDLSGPSWTGWGNDNANTRFQPAPGLRAADVPRLELKWVFGFPGDSMAFGQPTVAGGRVVTGSQGGRVYSLDAHSGCVHWVFDAGAGVRTAVVITPDGSAVFGDFTGRVLAVDAATGKLRWKTSVDNHPHARITAAPVFHGGRLYVPVSSFEEGPAANPKYACCTFRGSVVAMDAATGKIRWRFWTIPAAARQTGVTNSGTARFGPSGAAIWSTPTVDAARNALYVATGDNYTQPVTSLSDAIVALELDSGRLLWSRQMTSGDAWNAGCSSPGKENCPEGEGPDHDFGASPILVAMPQGRRALVCSQKSGMVYALDPDRRGETIWEARLAKGGRLGGLQWGPSTDGKALYAAISDAEWTKFGARIYGGFVLDPLKGGGLRAVEIASGRVVWSAPPGSCGGRALCSPAQSAAVAAMPGVVFSGSMDGRLRAYSTGEGRVVWEYDTARNFETVNGVAARGGSIDSAGPAIAGGMVFSNSGYGLFGGAPGNVLLAFGLSEAGAGKRDE